MKRYTALAAVAVLAAATLYAADGAHRAPSVEAVSGRPNLTMGNYDVGEFGYQVEEFFVSGSATSYRLAGEPSADGQWEALPATNAPYTTRIVVVRPKDAAKFSRTAVVEWLNVTGGLDMPVDWNMTHREILRRGHAYVAVSAQKVGIDGNPMAPGTGPAALKKADPARYGRLVHPGDAFAFDIFSQAGALVKNATGGKVLGPLVPERVLAVGESQSAYFLTTYVTAVDPVARVFDGFLIHSRFGNAAPLDANPMALFTGTAPVLKLRPDLRVPVLTVVTESDVLGFGPLKGFWEARQPDSAKLRVWEITGSAHADNYVFSVGFMDSGTLPIEKLAAAYAPSFEMFGQKLEQAMNFGPQHHYVVQAALWQLDRWVRTGMPAPAAPPLQLSDDRPLKLVTDEHGIAKAASARLGWMFPPPSSPGPGAWWVSESRSTRPRSSGCIRAGRANISRNLRPRWMKPSGRASLCRTTGRRFLALQSTVLPAVKVPPVQQSERRRTMNRALYLQLLLPLLTTVWMALRTSAAEPETIRLWPGAAPGTEDWNVKERTFAVTLKEFGSLELVTDITVPTLTLVRPEAGKANGAAVIVCPGGGFQFLSWQAEGMEVARWLADRGFTAAVLKYRVRMSNEVQPPGSTDTRTFEERLKAAEAKINLARADAVQAIRHLRTNAAKYGIAHDRIGLMGFSAGAMTTLSVVLKADAVDRPDFAASIYGAMEEVSVPKDAPPLFIVHTQADVWCLPPRRQKCSTPGLRRDAPLNCTCIRRARMDLACAGQGCRWTTGRRPLRNGCERLNCLTRRSRRRRPDPGATRRPLPHRGKPEMDG